jgi:hypothetical protein
MLLFVLNVEPLGQLELLARRQAGVGCVKERDSVLTLNCTATLWTGPLCEKNRLLCFPFEKQVDLP